MQEIHRWPVNSPHKWPVTPKMFPFDDVIMPSLCTEFKLMLLRYGNVPITSQTSNGSWCMGIKGEMSGTVCVTFTWYMYIWVVHSFCLFCCLFIIVTTQFVALYEPCKPKPKPKPSTYDTRTTTPWQRSKFRYLDRSQGNKYAINMQIQTISVSK